VYCFYRPYRRQASSHSNCIGLEADAVEVGAGLPAIGLLQVAQRLAAIAVTSTRMPSNASEATPTAARTGHGLLKKRW